MAAIIPSKVAARDISQTLANSKADGVVGKDIELGSYTSPAPNQAYAPEKSASNVGLDKLGRNGGMPSKRICIACCEIVTCRICCTD
ncbi:hypothetical protein PIB30_083553 [Stylosanthes scabra]|uniref:Uncharacterized protein n=1 Tax=Stylosanthes scabra TaxID=79078 RepID=A0ABU6QRX3_9FABA|nr:hypothetical protein [Stylosanthes scabra]